MTSAVSSGLFQYPRMTCGPRTQISPTSPRSEEHTSELQSRPHLVCRLLLEKKKNDNEAGADHGGRTSSRLDGPPARPCCVEGGSAVEPHLITGIQRVYRSRLEVAQSYVSQ